MDVSKHSNGVESHIQSSIKIWTKLNSLVLNTISTGMPPMPSWISSNFPPSGDSFQNHPPEALGYKFLALGHRDCPVIATMMALLVALPFGGKPFRLTPPFRSFELPSFSKRELPLSSTCLVIFSAAPASNHLPLCSSLCLASWTYIFNEKKNDGQRQEDCWQRT